MTQLSIVLPVFNKVNFTMSAINDFSRLENDHEIIVIDNASSDETQDKLSSMNRQNLVYIRNDENLFHSKACNIGFARSKGKYVLFINNAIKVRSNHANWVDDLIKYCDDYIVGPTMGLLDNEFNFVKESNEELKGNSYLSGWCLASSRENWEKISVDNQIFCEELKFYFNDTDIGFKCREIGMPMKVVDIPVVHFGKISASQFNIPKLYTEARKIFVNKWSKHDTRK